MNISENNSGQWHFFCQCKGMTTDAVIKKTDGTTLNIGRCTQGKMHLFRAMQASGDAVCDFLNDAGEFEFVWNTNNRNWDFFSESGEKVATLLVERDLEAEKTKKLAYYRESVAAYNAQQGI